jgi:hypothetical protein
MGINRTQSHNGPFKFLLLTPTMEPREDGFDICIEEYRHTVIPPCNNWHDRGADDTTGKDGSAVPDQTRSSLLARVR